MKYINLSKEGVLEYYGNKAGYVRNNTAFVDEMFQKADLADFLEKENGLEIEWQSGIYERLIQGRLENTNRITLKNCRLYQLKSTTDVRMRFIGYDDLKEKGFAEPNMGDYKVVYDGNIGTNDLESIYQKFDSGENLEGFSENGIYISDVIELYDEESSEFYYVNPKGFEKLQHFTEPKNEPVREQKEKQEQVAEQKENKPFETVKPQIEQTEQSAEPEEFQVETFKITM